MVRNDSSNLLLRHPWWSSVSMRIRHEAGIYGYVYADTGLSCYSQLAKDQQDRCGFTAPNLYPSLWTSVIIFWNLVLMLPLICLWLHGHFCISDYLLLKRFFKSDGVLRDQSSVRESIPIRMLDWLWRELGPFPSTANIASVFRHAIYSSICKTWINISSLEAGFIKNICHVFVK